MKLVDYIKTGINKWPNWINLILLRCNIFGGRVYGGTYLRFLKQIDDINPQEKLLEMVNYAIENVPYYRNKYKGLRIHSVAEFEEKIGFIDKTEVMEHWDEFIADGVDLSTCRIGTTGGTSGKPLKLVAPSNFYAIELSFIHRLWFKCGWKYNTRGVIRNHNLNGKDYEINPITKEVIFDAFRISDEYVRNIVTILKRYNIEFIHSYPSSAYQFCKVCKKNHLDISFIRSFLCGSEGVTDEQRSFFSKNNISLYSWYGHSEKLILAGYDYSYKGLEVESNYGFFELIDEDNNSIQKNNTLGEMVGTAFYNKEMPLIRYRTGDFTQMSSHSSEKITLENVLGRWEKSLIYKGDGTLTSLTALNLHGDFHDHIDGMQYLQEKKGELTVLIIKNTLYSEEDELFIREHLDNAMGSGDTIRIEYVDKLIFQANGKFLPLISKIK